MTFVAALASKGKVAAAHRPWPRVVIDAEAWRQAVLGWGLVLGVVAIAGMPPLGIFMSEFLIVSSTFAREPLLAIPLVGGLLVAFGALFLRLNGLAFGEPAGSTAPVSASYVPMYVHFALVFAAGIYLPPSLVVWFQHIAGLLG